jgi:hypothetical protein
VESAGESSEEVATAPPLASPGKPKSSLAKNVNVRHRCLQAFLPSVNKADAPDLCHRGRPAELAPDNVKLHYVAHYIQRGSFDHMVKAVAEGEKYRYEAYECNLCPFKARNDPAKQKFTGERGCSSQ